MTVRCKSENGWKQGAKLREKLIAKPGLPRSSHLHSPVRRQMRLRKNKTEFTYKRRSKSHCDSLAFSDYCLVSVLNMCFKTTCPKMVPAFLPKPEAGVLNKRTCGAKIVFSYSFWKFQMKHKTENGDHLSKPEAGIQHKV